jgi:ATP-dependent HslUV protease subunit HslV
MTTIVVVRKGNQACIAADTLTSFGAKKYSATYKAEASKILRLGESWVGLIGAPAHRQVMESLVREHAGALRLDSRQAIFESFRALHPVLKEQYFLNPKEEKEPYETIQLDMLIANRHGTFYLSTLRDVYEFSRFWAIGSGCEFALGALYARYDQKLDARAIAEGAVRAACEFDNASALPLTSHVVALEGGRGGSSPRSTFVRRLASRRQRRSGRK